MRRKVRPSSAFHISKACPSAYKVFFSGARGAYMVINQNNLGLVSVSKSRGQRVRFYALPVGQQL
jgi:hypothetical protein